ncbi:hypothetical protein JCM8208_003046, partial [Rhodotorula glutinis]
LVDVSAASSRQQPQNGALAHAQPVLETQPLDDVTGGGEVAGGDDVSQVVGLSNESLQEHEQPSLVVGLSNE